MSSLDALRDARKITSSLRRTRKTMEYGLMQADAAVEILLKDGDSIRHTLETHKNELKASLEASKGRLKKVKYMQYYEKLSLRVSFAFFMIVVVYIIAKRLRVIQVTTFLIKYGVPAANDLRKLYGRHFPSTLLSSYNESTSEYITNTTIEDNSSYLHYETETFQELDQVLSETNVSPTIAPEDTLIDLKQSNEVFREDLDVILSIELDKSDSDTSNTITNIATVESEVNVRVFDQFSESKEVDEDSLTQSSADDNYSDIDNHISRYEEVIVTSEGDVVIEDYVDSESVNSHPSI